MKRSEMLDILEGTLTQESMRQMIQDGIPDTKKMAKAILNQIEYSGMLPPFRLDSQYGLKKYTRFYEWEDEDEA